MKNSLKLLAGLFLVSSTLAIAEESGKIPVSEKRAVDILRSIDDMWRGESSFATITMKVKTRNYERTMTMKAWSKGSEKSLVRIVYPLKEKGTASLKSGASIYTYLPKTDRAIRLTSGMMMGSWMGSHFTNDDLIKESRLTEDYYISITFEGERDGVALIEFTLIPKESAPVVWGKVTLTVEKENMTPTLEIYYDEDMNVARRMVFSDIKNLGGRMVPTVLRVVPEDKPDEFTELLYEKMEFDIGLPDSFFSLSALRRR